MVDEPQLPDSWLRPDPSRAAGLARRAAMEIGRGHQLHGHTLTAVATCTGCDDVIFRLEDGTFAQVHLTWTRHPPECVPYPRTRLLASYREMDAAATEHAANH